MRVYLGLGSNLDAEQHLDEALEQLQNEFGALRCSSWFRTAAVGFSGPDFINMALCVDTDLSVEDVSQICQKIERFVGRRRETESGCGSRCIDIDLLLFEAAAGEPHANLPPPRDDLWRFAYCAAPMADIYPHWTHCQLQGLTLAQFVKSESFASQPIEKLELQQAG